MQTDRIVPQMIELARDARSMTQADLAQRSGVTQALISKIENRLIAQPSEEVIVQLANTLGFPREFFYQEDMKRLGLPLFHMRQQKKLGAKPLAHIGAMISIRRQHVARLLRSYELDVVKPIPQIDLDESGLTPEKVAERLRGYWMLPRGPVSNVVDIVEEAGGIVFLCRFGTALLDGISFRSEGLPPLFFMNKDVPGDRFRFSLAHELGHIVMHTMPGDDQTMEEEARRFAAAFLMPASDIRSYLAEPKLTTLSRVKAYWKVPIKTLIQRAYDLKLITEHQHKTVSAQYNKSFREGEPIEIEQEAPSRMRKIVHHHMEKLGYTTADLARTLCMNEQELRQTLGQRPRLELVVSN